MSYYVMSDLHGCQFEFERMLELIEFSDYDELYIIGDVCDRGNKPIDLLLEIMKHPNIHLILGNHDQWFCRYIDRLIDAKKDISLLNRTTIPNDLYAWIYQNGGLITVDQFLELDLPTCYDIKDYLEQCPTYFECHCCGHEFLFVHAGLGEYSNDPNIRISQIDPNILLWSHIDIDDCPFKDKIMVVGHIPTFAYGKQYEGKIIRGQKPIYHIDCGCVYGKTLGCLRLNDFKEFYIPSTYHL